MCENSLDCEALSHAMMCDGTRSTKRSRRVAEASFLVIVWRCLALSFARIGIGEVRVAERKR